MSNVVEPRYVISRRAMLRAAAGGIFTLAAAQVLAGCSGGSGGGFQLNGGSPGASIQQISLDTTAPANVNSEVHLLTVTDSDGNTTVFYGLKDLAGLAQQLTQSLTFQGSAAVSVRTIYDANGRPVRVILPDGAFYTIAYDASSATFKFYDKDGKFLGGGVATATGAGNSSFDVSALSLPQITGSFEGTLTGGDSGLVTFVAGSQTSIVRGNAIVPDAFISPLKVRSKGPRASAVRNDSGVISALAGVFNTDQLTRNLQNAIGNGGNNSLLSSLLSAAGAVPGNSGPVFDGTSFGQTASLASAASLAGLAFNRLKQIQDALSKGAELLKDNLAQFVTGAPAGSTPANLANLTPPLPGTAPTTVNGVAVTDLLGIVNLTGKIKPSGDVTLTGTATNGTPFSFNGNVSTGKVTNGAWTAGPKRGTWSSQPAQTGQCQALQSSGGQGKYTKIFNLGRTSGKFTVFYNMFSIPDRMDIFLDGKTIFTTSGLVSGSKTTTVNFSGSQSSIIVVMTAPNNGTSWNYSIGCPT